MEWISVKNVKPEVHVDVLLLYSDGRVDVDCRYATDGFLMEVVHGPVTHWMPLPEPPKED